MKKRTTNELIALRKEIEVVFSYRKVMYRIRKIAREISDEFEGQEITLIGVLQGATIFYSLLAIQIGRIGKIPLVAMDTMCVSSYGDEHESNGEVCISFDVRVPIRGKIVVVADDLIDTSRTMKEIVRLMKARKAKAVKVACLMVREGVTFKPDYSALVLPKGVWGVGFGLNEGKYYRNLDFVGGLPK